LSLAFYKPTGGFFERAHPVTKLICLILAFVPPFFSSRPLQVLPFFTLLLLVALFSGSGTNIRRVWVLMLILFVMSGVLWTFFYQGPSGSIIKLGPISIRSSGLLYGLTVGLRLNCFVLVAVIFLTCTRIEDFTFGLSRLGLPFVVSFALSLAFRLTPLFMETGQTIVMAQKARGLDLDSGGPLKRIRRYVPIIIPILVSSLRRADQLAVALESKGFGSGVKRSMLAEYPVTWRDFVLLAATMSVLALTGFNYYIFKII